jgi:hypothetical protein
MSTQGQPVARTAVGAANMRSMLDVSSTGTSSHSSRRKTPRQMHQGTPGTPPFRAIHQQPFPTCNIFCSKREISASDRASEEPSCAPERAGSPAAPGSVVGHGEGDGEGRNLQWEAQRFRPQPIFCHAGNRNFLRSRRLFFFFFSCKPVLP